MKKIDQSSIRAQNLAHIYDVLLAHPSVTRQQIAADTGLSLMSVSNLVEQLSRNGALRVVREEAQEKKKRQLGRKAEKIALNTQLGVWLILDLTGLRLRFSIMALDHATLDESTPLPFSGGSYEEHLRGFLREAAAHVADRGLSILGVAAVVPGPYNAEIDRVRNKRIPQINEIDIKALLRECIGDYYIYVDEDVKFAARSYFELSGEPEVDLLYYLYIGEGVGGAIVHERQVVRGLNAVAGDPSQLEDSDGAHIEPKLSLRAFAARVLEGDMTASSESVLLSRLTQAAKERPDAYWDALQAQAQCIGRLLVSVAWLVDPRLVVVNCHYAEPFEEAFMRVIHETLEGSVAGGLECLSRLKHMRSGMKATYLGAVKMLEKDWIGRME